MHASRRLTGGVEAGNRRGLGVGLYADPTHGVVAGRTDLHGRRCDVDIGQLLELVVHGRQEPTDLLGRAATSDIQEDAAVRASSARFDLGVDGSRDLVSREQLGGPAEVDLVLVPLVGFLDRVGRLGGKERRDVVEHEALAVPIL